MGVYDHTVRIGRGSRPGLGGLATAVLVATLALLALTAVAGAEVLPATCSNLQSRITSLGAKPDRGEGDTIVLDGMCDEKGLGFATGVTIPEGVYLTIEGAAGTTSGLDGTGVTGVLLSTVEDPSQDGTVTLSHLTFQHATHGAVSLVADRVALEGDSFLENTDSERPGAAYVVPGIGHCPASGQSAAAIVDSTFHGNDSVVEGSLGGAVGIYTPCASNPIVIEGNTFEGNLLRASEPFTSTGGALAVLAETEPPAPLEQRGNVFAGNRVEGPAGGNYGGGGEWLEGVGLTSVGDRFSANTISGTTGSKAWSWGAGLGILSCNASTPTQSTLEDGVVEGNSIEGGEAKDAGGAAIYVGCTSSESNYVTLLDSTVTENTVPSGGTAGVDGDTNDRLTIENSILAEDLGGEEIKGFSGAGGALAVSFSDVCAGGTTPLSGEGNICADPKLNDDGISSSPDVHETAASPTIEAGSNALVPGDLASDFYGNERILPTRAYLPACAPGATIGLTYYPAIVDMGASEYGPVALPAFAVFCPGVGGKALPPTPSVFAFPGIVSRASGLLRLAFEDLATGKLAVLATCKVSKTVVSTVKGHRISRRKLATIVYGHTVYTVSSSGRVTVQLEPNRQALALLERHKHLKVTLSVTFTATGELPTTHTQTISVKYIKPHHEHRS